MIKMHVGLVSGMGSKVFWTYWRTFGLVGRCCPLWSSSWSGVLTVWVWMVASENGKIPNVKCYLAWWRARLFMLLRDKLSALPLQRKVTKFPLSVGGLAWLNSPSPTSKPYLQHLPAVPQICCFLSFPPSSSRLLQFRYITPSSCLSTFEHCDNDIVFSNCFPFLYSLFIYGTRLNVVRIQYSSFSPTVIYGLVKGGCYDDFVRDILRGIHGIPSVACMSDTGYTDKAPAAKHVFL